MRPALLVIDIQNQWLDTNPGLKSCLEKRVGAINSAIDLFRRKGLPIIPIFHVDKDGTPKPDAEGFNFLPSIGIESSDIRVIKNYPDAFNRTELADILESSKVDTVILCGLSATCCVMATYVGAENHDLSPYLLRGGVAAGSEEKVGFAEEILQTMALDELEQALRP